MGFGGKAEKAWKRASRRFGAIVGAYMSLKIQDQYAWDRIASKYPPGTEVVIEIFKERTLQYQGYYWAMLDHVISSTGIYKSVEVLHHELKLILGYSFKYVGLDGTIREVVDSTAFDNMDEAEFNEYVQKARLFMTEKFGFDPGDTDQWQSASLSPKDSEQGFSSGKVGGAISARSPFGLGRSGT